MKTTWMTKCECELHDDIGGTVTNTSQINPLKVRFHINLWNHRWNFEQSRAKFVRILVICGKKGGSNKQSVGVFVSNFMSGWGKSSLFAVMSGFSLLSAVFQTFLSVLRFHCEPGCPTLRLCWFRGLHPSIVLPWKRLIRALWLAINNNLLPSSSLRCLSFRSGGRNQNGQNAAHKMWLPASKAFWESITVHIPQRAARPPGKPAPCPSAADKALWCICNVEITTANTALLKQTLSSQHSQHRDAQINS